MGLTREQAERCGLGHLFPDPAPAVKGDAGPAAKTKHGGRNDLGQNKTEAAFQRLLDEMLGLKQVRGFHWEPFKLRLAGNTTYSPDFVVERIDGSFAVVEIKGGFAREDSLVKLKVAAEQFRWLADFYLVRKDKAQWRGWDVRAVSRAGFGVHPVGGGWALSDRRAPLPGQLDLFK